MCGIQVPVKQVVDSMGTNPSHQDTMENGSLHHVVWLN